MDLEFDIKAVDTAWKILQPDALEQIPGRSSLVRALMTNVKHQAFSIPVILHGPTGVGKLMLARLYAKAVLCEKASANGSSCNRCDKCVSFDRGQYGLTYVEHSTLDIALQDKPDTIEKYQKCLMVWANKVQEFLNASTINTPRRVVVLGQADRYPAEAFDVLLKAIEDLVDKTEGRFIRATRTTLVFLASDVNRVRRAGRSRCLDYRLRQLSDADSRDLFRSLVIKTGVPSDERALDMLVQAASGFPGRIKRIFYLVASTGAITVESVTEALKLDWAGDTANYLSALFNYRNMTSDFLRPKDNIDLSKQVRRIKSLLYQIRPQSQPVSPGMIAYHDAAFMYAQHDLVKVLSDKLIICGKAQGKSPVSLWQDLIELWVNSEITDDFSFSEVGRRTEYLLRSGDEINHR